MTENSAILEMSIKTIPLQETRQETLFPLRQGSSVYNAAVRQRSDAVFYYVKAAPES